jgi:hypothetical protein
LPNSQVIPLTSAANQSLTVALAVDGGTLTLNLAVRFNKVAGYWMLSISDRFGVLLLANLPFVCGYYPAANILAPWVFLGIGSAYVVNASGSEEDYPDENSLGVDFVLVWSDTPTA